jgi:peptide/nickel transport system substrate-binding protein
VSTAVLTFVSGKFDITFGGLSVPLTSDVKSQAPEAFCELNPTNVSRNLVINRDVAPFDQPELRRAM